MLLEQFEQGHARGSSHGTERIVRLGYTSVEYVELGLEAMRGWRELEDECGEELLHVTGAIDVGYDDELDAVAAAFSAGGVRFEWLTGAAAAERWPGLADRGRVLHQPDGGWISADLALAALVDGAVLGGAAVRWSTPVAAVEVVVDGVRIVTDDEVYEASAVVVAAGAWASKILDGHVALPPLTVTDELVAYFEPEPGVGPWPCFIHRASPLLYGLPSPTGRIKVGEHSSGPVVDPDVRSFVPDPTGLASLAAAVPEVCPGLRPVPLDAHQCLYATTPTDDFVLDRRGPIVIAAGLGGHGFKFGPAIGRILADLALGIRADGAPADSGPFGLGAGAAAGPGRSGSR